VGGALLLTPPARNKGSYPLPMHYAKAFVMYLTGEKITEKEVLQKKIEDICLHATTPPNAMSGIESGTYYQFWMENSLLAIQQAVWQIRIDGTASYKMKYEGHLYESNGVFTMIGTRFIVGKFRRDARIPEGEADTIFMLKYDLEARQMKGVICGIDDEMQDPFARRVFFKKVGEAQVYDQTEPFTFRKPVDLKVFWAQNAGLKDYFFGKKDNNIMPMTEHIGFYKQMKSVFDID
jgi:hypothetical protein